MEKTTTTTALEMFASNMEALGIPPGAARLDCFLRLPMEMQKAIVAEILGPADLDLADSWDGS